MSRDTCNRWVPRPAALLWRAERCFGFRCASRGVLIRLCFPGLPLPCGKRKIHFCFPTLCTEYCFSSFLECRSPVASQKSLLLSLRFAQGIVFFFFPGIPLPVASRNYNVFFPRFARGIVLSFVPAFRSSVASRILYVVSQRFAQLIVVLTVYLIKQEKASSRDFSP